ncbi:bifunctional hydroxymethylpyrimidine kinase/phosphomethylpyrimidine kinase [Patescibacteria group bacterium]|nr:bifunctional hydroxymethylpyrimidine kinase/phosphomethylpyrimidine kinase [Patescibacteria group bacterium]
METNKLSKIADNFKGKKIGVVGDLMLDHFMWGDVRRISPEAPVPVVSVTRESFVPGGAANTANNIVALRGEVFIIGVVGSDVAGRQLISELKKGKVNTDGIFTDKNRVTTQKIRVVDKDQQVVRADKEKTEDINKRQEKQAIDFITSHIKDWDGLVVSDYNKGIVTINLIQKIIKLAGRYKKTIIADTKPTHFSYFKNITLLVPNNKEAVAMAGTDDIKEAGKIIQKQLNCNVLIKRGAKGMTLFENSRVKNFPTKAKEVFDVVGAGDTVAATLILALVSGANLGQAVMLANHAAGIVVGKIGTAVVSLEELKKDLKNEL